MTKTLLVLTIFLATIACGAAIKCYVCGGSESSDCAKGIKSAMSVVNCRSRRPNYDEETYVYNDSSEESSEDHQKVASCLNFVKNNYQPKLVVRACGIFPASVEPCDILQKHGRITNCKSCKTDLCNNQVVYEDEEEVDNIGVIVNANE